MVDLLCQYHSRADIMSDNSLRFSEILGHAGFCEKEYLNIIFMMTLLP